MLAAGCLKSPVGALRIDTSGRPLGTGRPQPPARSRADRHLGGRGLRPSTHRDRRLLEHVHGPFVAIALHDEPRRARRRKQLCKKGDPSAQTFVSGWHSTARHT